MKIKHTALAVILLIAALYAGSIGQSRNLTEEQAYTLGLKAYIYAFPLVLMEVTKRVSTNVVEPEVTKGRASINQFSHMPMFPSPQFKDVVRPNLDTLYSMAWLDLSCEPIVLTVPDTQGRFYLMHFMDAWTETFAVPGKRTTGTKTGRFAIVGPDWKGGLPKGIQKIKAPTNTVWIIGRTQTNGKDDYANVHRIQQQYKLTPLSALDKSSKPPTISVNPAIDMITPPVQQVAKMDAATFFKTFSEALKVNAPHQADASLLTELKAIGIEAGKDFNLQGLEASIVQGLQRAVKDAPRQIPATLMNLRKHNTWRYFGQIGRYATAYLDRAAVAYVGLGALPVEDAVYMTAITDHEDKTLNGSNRYLLHFDKSELPPVRAFWSVTLYNPEGFFAENLLGRYALGDRDKLQYNADGSLDIYFQRESPGKDKESNWLPAPASNFTLSLRLYWPQLQVLNQTWEPPAVRRIH